MSIVVDASVWISAWLPADIHHAQSRQWLEAQVNTNELLLAPILVLPEVAGAIARRTGNSALAAQAIARMKQTPSLRLTPIDQRAGDLAAQLAADLQLRGADAVYVAVAHELHIPLATWDDEQGTRAAMIITTVTP
jgi:predicted nucleic acid-binding protein